MEQLVSKSSTVEQSNSKRFRQSKCQSIRDDLKKKKRGIIPKDIVSYWNFGI